MKRLWEFLGAVRLAIILLIVLAVVSVVGIIIPQGLATELYLQKWGAFRGKLILWCHVDRMFSALWFYGLLLLLSLNVFVCSVTRLFRNLRRSTTAHFLANAAAVSRCKHTVDCTVAGTREDVARKARALLKRRRYFTAQKSENTGDVQVWGNKGLLKDIASLVFHLSLVLLLVGGLIGRMTGYSYHQKLIEGQVAPVRDRDFSVRLDRFELERNDRGQIKDYRSKLTLLALDDREILTREIEVNSPLSHQGIQFYQSSYGTDAGSADNLRFLVGGHEMDSLTNVVTVDELGVPARIGTSDMWITVSRFLSDFMFDTRSHQAFSRSLDHHNPAAYVTVNNAADTVYQGWVFVRHPGVHAPEGGYKVNFTGYDQRLYTGILVRKNPGVPMIWVGIILMSLAVCTMFYMSRCNVWVAVTQADDHTVRAVLGGSSANRNAIVADLEHVKRALGPNV